MFPKQSEKEKIEKSRTKGKEEQNDNGMVQKEKEQGRKIITKVDNDINEKEVSKDSIP